MRYDRFELIPDTLRPLLEITHAQEEIRIAIEYKGHRKRDKKN